MSSGFGGWFPDQECMETQQVPNKATGTSAFPEEFAQYWAEENGLSIILLVRRAAAWTGAGLPQLFRAFSER